MGARSARVVLVHGAGDRSASFRRVARRLAQHEVVTYDRRGYGDSAGLAPSSDISRHAADLLEVVGPVPAVVVGHSYGGLIALVAAERHAEPLIQAVGFYEPPAPWTDWFPRRGDAAPADPGAAAEWFLRGVLGDATWERMPEREQERRRAEGPALVGDLDGAIRGRPFDPASVLVPTVGAHGGRHDRYERSVSEIVDALPDCAVEVLAGAGHGAHLSHPDAFARFTQRVVDAAAPAGR